jgi:tetratricopeptide (TPR) repeat protein
MSYKLIIKIIIFLGFLLSGCATTNLSKHVPNEDALEVFKQGSELLNSDPKQALELFDKASSIDKNLVAAFYNAGVALELLNNLEEAAKRYESCLSVNKLQASCLENLVLVLAKSNKLEEANKLLDQYLESYPEELFVKVAKAKLELWQKNYPEAENLARFVIERDADNAEALFVMAQIFYDTKQYEASKWVLKNGLEIAPTHGGMYLTLGDVNSKLDLLADALEDYAFAVKYQPTKEALESYGLLLLKQGRDQEGLNIFKRLSETRPEDYQNQLHLGNAYMANRDFERAKEAYLTAEKLSEDKDVLFNLGLLYLDLKPEGILELERLKESRKYFLEYLKQKSLSKEKINEVQGYLKILANRIEALEYMATPPEPQPEQAQPAPAPVEPAVEQKESHEQKEPLKAPKEGQDEDFLQNL